MHLVGTTPNLNVLRLPAVCRMTGLRRSTIYRMQANGQFPRRVRIGARGQLDRARSSGVAGKPNRGHSLSFRRCGPPPKQTRPELASGVSRPQSAPPSAGGRARLHGQFQSECRQNCAERVQPRVSFIGQRAIQRFPAESGSVRQHGHSTEGVGNGAKYNGLGRHRPPTSLRCSRQCSCRCAGDRRRETARWALRIL